MHNGPFRDRKWRYLGVSIVVCWWLKFASCVLNIFTFFCSFEHFSYIWHNITENFVPHLFKNLHLLVVLKEQYREETKLFSWNCCDHFFEGWWPCCYWFKHWDIGFLIMRYFSSKNDTTKVQSSFCFCWLEVPFSLPRIELYKWETLHVCLIIRILRCSTKPGSQFSL